LEDEIGVIFYISWWKYFLSVEYGVKDDFNDKSKEIIFHGISRSNKLYVKHCETAKEILDRLQILYLRGKLYTLEMEKNANDSTHIAVINQ